MNNIDIILMVLGIAFIVLSFLLRSTKVPRQLYKSEAVYSDHKEKPEKALLSDEYGLIGRPDFILHTKDGLLPLEIKNSKRPSKPYFSHVMQLVSYCLLIEETRKEKPKYGFIQYQDGKAFAIPYTEGRKSFLIKLMQEIRGFIDSGKCPKPVHGNKCEGCGYKDRCFLR